MMIEVTVEVSVRKGLGPEWAQRFFPFGYDDLPEGTTKAEVQEMARRDVESQLYNSDDYRLYGKNWTIVDYQWT